VVVIGFLVLLPARERAATVMEPPPRFRPCGLLVVVPKLPILPPPPASLPIPSSTKIQILVPILPAYRLTLWEKGHLLLPKRIVLAVVVVVIVAPRQRPSKQVRTPRWWWSVIIVIVVAKRNRLMLQRKICRSKRWWRRQRGRNLEARTAAHICEKYRDRDRDRRREEGGGGGDLSRVFMIR